MRAFAAALLLQARVMRADPDYLMPLALVPLWTVTFLAIFGDAHRRDLDAYAIVAPVLMALWGVSVFCSGEIVESDRWHGVLEPAISTPAPLELTIVARILAVTGVGFVSLAEVWIVARLGFGVAVHVRHPGAFLLTLAVSGTAMAATALVMASLFVLARTARSIQNVLSFPFFVLGGVLVPVSFLPPWIQPISKAVFLSWSADLLRDSLDGAAVPHLARRAGIVLGLALAAFLVGSALLRRILRHVRADGTLGLA